MAPRIRLGELLVRAGVLDEFKLNAALAEQKRWGGKLGKILVDMNFVSEEILVKALSKQLAVPLARLENMDVGPEILTKVDAQFARSNSLCPERMMPQRRALVVAMADPINIKAIDEITHRTGLRVEPTLAGERTISIAISQLYGTDASSLSDSRMSVLTNNSGRVFEASRPPEVGAEFEMLPLAAPLDDETSGIIAGPKGAVSHAPPPIPSPAPAPMPVPIEDSPLEQMAAALEDAQRKQLKAIRAMVDLLVDKGYLSRDEYLQRLNRR